MKNRTRLRVVVLCLFMAATVNAQRNITAFGTPITEDFNSLGTGNVNLTDNTTIQGFYTFRTSGNATPNASAAGNGSSNAPQFYNFGSAAEADRAAGSVTTGGGTGSTYLGIRLANTTSNTIGSITVAFTGEQWRRGAGGIPGLAFSYQVGPSVTSLTAGSWTAVTALDFAAPNQGGPQTALDGNAAGNRTALSSTFAVNLPAGQEIMLRWEHAPAGGQPWGLGVDDVSVTAVAPSSAPAAISGRVLAANGRGVSRALITVTDFNGESRGFFTNTFGYFSASGLSAGQSYIVSVSAKGYTFPNSSQLVDLSDSVSGLGFIAR